MFAITKHNTYTSKKQTTQLYNLNKGETYGSSTITVFR